MPDRRLATLLHPEPKVPDETAGQIALELIAVVSSAKTSGHTVSGDGFGLTAARG
ncbi:MAG: hypothetical protein OXP73_12665 [Chloroflexota bacterium]|nr:hypothetical protein [Chloroflexota bacterium]